MTAPVAVAPAMLHLGEREVGFDTAAIGFPSIDGCHAVVLCTSSGLYGFHNLGGSGVASFAERSQSFAAFVSQHFISRGTLHHLYGTCFRNKRGYADANKLAAWKDEMRAYATALGYTGPVSGFDLGRMTYGARSAYVEYRKVGKVCTIHCKPWNEMTYTKHTNNNRVNHKKALSGAVQALTTDIYDTITPNGGGAIYDVPKGQLDKFTV
jgi:hypothetical protein